MIPRHPAKFSDAILDAIARILNSRENKRDLLDSFAGKGKVDKWNLLDPFAGTGKVAEIKNREVNARVTCNEIEEDWCYGNSLVDEWHAGDAENMDWASNGQFNVIVTSPAYGNRMADHHVARDASRRNTYTHAIGHQLKDGNTGKMQWGDQYRQKHTRIYGECYRVLSPGGLFILNISDHVRKGVIVSVSSWHVTALSRAGFKVDEIFSVDTPRNRFGENREKRAEQEWIVVLVKQEGR